MSFPGIVGGWHNPDGLGDRLGGSDMSTDFATVWAAAHEAGHGAATAITPRTVVFGSPSTPLGSDVDYSKPFYVETEGVCGFAWVEFAGNTAFGRWAKSAGLARKGYPKGLSYWVSGYGQSMERKEAYAQAFADVLRGSGIKAYAASRMD